MCSDLNSFSTIGAAWVMLWILIFVTLSHPLYAWFKRTGEYRIFAPKAVFVRSIRGWFIFIPGVYLLGHGHSYRIASCLEDCLDPRLPPITVSTATQLFGNPFAPPIYSRERQRER